MVFNLALCSLFFQCHFHGEFVAKCSPILGQRELEFSGVKAQLGGGADEPLMSEIGTFCQSRCVAGTRYTLYANPLILPARR